MATEKPAPATSLKELALLFIKLGTIGFGGPAAHIAMMQEEVVKKRKWMDEQHFLDLIGATNLIPGPNSTEMAIHIGREQAGWKGLLVSGMCFILPAVIITAGIAALYKTYGSLPRIQPFIYGIKPAIIAIIAAAVYPLARKSLKTTELGLIGILSLILSLSGIHELYVLAGAGFVALFLASVHSNDKPVAKSVLPLTLLKLSNPAGSGLFFTFLKIGSIIYGSGYVLFAFLDTELVTKGIISRQQLMDAIAVGQFTPGPVFSAVTFIGYQINAISGASIATLGIFIPSFLFVALLNPLVRKMRNSKSVSVFLDAVNVASMGIIAAICIVMGKESISDWRSALITLCSLVLVFGFKKVNSALVVVGGAVLGYLLSLI